MNKKNIRKLIKMKAISILASASFVSQAYVSMLDMTPHDAPRKASYLRHHENVDSLSLRSWLYASHQARHNPAKDIAQDWKRDAYWKMNSMVEQSGWHMNINVKSERNQQDLVLPSQNFINGFGYQNDYEGKVFKLSIDPESTQELYVHIGNQTHTLSLQHSFQTLYLTYDREKGWDSTSKTMPLAASENLQEVTINTQDHQHIPHRVFENSFAAGYIHAGMNPYDYMDLSELVRYIVLSGQEEVYIPFSQSRVLELPVIPRHFKAAMEGKTIVFSSNPYSPLVVKQYGVSKTLVNANHTTFQIVDGAWVEIKAD